MQDTKDQQSGSKQQQKQLRSYLQKHQQKLQAYSASSKQMEEVDQEAIALDRLEQMLDRLGNGEHVDEKQLLATDFNQLLDQIIISNEKALKEFDELDERLQEVKQWLGQSKERY